MPVVKVELQDRGYDIEIGVRALDRIGVSLASLGDVSRVVIIVDEIVEPLYAERAVSSITDRGLDLDVVVIPAGEESKSIDVAYYLWNKFLELGVDRRSVAVALGGGVVGDLVGFVAATYARGIRFFQVPTTLLAQVDSSVGGKTAIDLPRAKNMVGAFHQPVGVLIDPAALQTLDKLQYGSGLGEVVKYGTSLDADLFKRLERDADLINAREPNVLGEIVAQCCRIKAQIVAEDERDLSGRRALLNYGHTFGHAIETALGYGTIPHGYGVLIGAILAARLAQTLGQNGDARFQQIDETWIERQTTLYRRLNLPTSPQDLGREYGDSQEFTRDALVKLMEKDKKAEFGKLNFVLPTALGSCVVAKQIDADAVLQVLR